MKLFSENSGMRERITDIYIITMLFIFPLFPGFEGYKNITLSKYVFLLSATVLWLLALVIASIRMRCGTGRMNAAQIAALVFLAICVLSWFFSPFRRDGFLGAGRYDGLLTIAVYVFIFLGVSAFGQPKRIYAYAFAAGIVLCCVIAYLQLFRVNVLHLFPGDLSYYDSGVRYSGTYLGTIGNTNLLDAVFCLAIPLFFTLLVRERMFLLCIPLLLSIGVEMIAGGTGAVLALTVFVPTAMILLPRSRRLKRIFSALAAAFVLGAMAVIFFWKGEVGPIWELSQVLHGHLEDSFGSSRVLIWRKCLGLVSEHPLLGGGPGTLPLRLDIEFSRLVPETGQTLASYVDNAHNIYLAYLVNCGALGLIAYLGLIICALRAAHRSKHRLIPALVPSLICAAVHAFFGLGLCIDQPFFWLLLGLVCTRDVYVSKEVTK